MNMAPHSVLVLWLAVLLDRLLGDPRRFHPLAGFGRLATELESRVRTGALSALSERVAGIVCVTLLIVPVSLVAWLLVRTPLIANLAEVVLLYFCIASRSLEEHAQAVLDALRSGTLASARAAIGRIVSRDTESLDRGDIARGSVESVLENGNDAIFGALFWFLLLGVPGAVAYRLANTLDAMWGYRNERFQYFGWAAARFDDVLNFIPARLTALTYCVAGNLANGWQCWQVQARLWYSPNAGPVMAAGAGALSVVLGGRAKYSGEWKERPVLGRGHDAAPEDIAAAILLLRRSLIIWLVAITLVTIAVTAVQSWTRHA